VGQDREVAALPQRGVEIRRGSQQMLQVVQHQQDRLLPEECRQRREGVLAGKLAHAYDARDRRQSQAGIGQRREIDEPDPIGIALRHLLGDGDGQPGLAHPTRSGQGQQANLLLGQEGAEEGQLVLAVDQPGRLGRQLGRDAGHGGGLHRDPSRGWAVAPAIAPGRSNRTLPARTPQWVRQQRRDGTLGSHDCR
jgi:hypothetical protein